MDMTVYSGNNQMMPFQNANPTAIAAAETAKVAIQSAYQIAMYNPRKPDEARQRILKECERPSFAELAEYSKPIGGTSIKGASIRLVEVALQNWRNCKAEATTVYEDDNIQKIKVFVQDYETNVNFSDEVNITKNVERKSNKGREVIGERLNSYGDKVYIVKATDDEILIKKASAVSKMIRNCGLRLLPKDLIEEALDKCRTTLARADKTDPDKRRKAMLDAFLKDLSIDSSKISRYLGHSTENVTPQELQNLRGIYSAIKDGEAQWSDYVQDDAQDKAETKLDAIKEKIKSKKSPIEPIRQKFQEIGIQSDDTTILNFAKQHIVREFDNLSELTEAEYESLMAELKNYESDNKGE